VHHRLHASSDRAKTRQPQQVEGCGAQRGHGSSPIAAAAVGILVELGIADPVPALNALAVTHELQQGFWGGAQAGEKHVGGPKGLAIAAAAVRHPHDPARANPYLANLLWCFFCPQRPGNVPTVTALMIHCDDRVLALSLQLPANLTVKRFLVYFHRQKEVGSLLLELPKNGFWVCRTSA